MTKDEIKLVMQWCLPLDTTSKKLDELVETFANEHKEAINYSQCCKTLPTKEEMTLEKRKTFKRIDEGIMNLDKMSYGVGFRKCFSWLSKDKHY